MAYLELILLIEMGVYFNEREIRTIASSSGVGEKAAQRLLGPLKVELMKTVTVEDIVKNPNIEATKQSFDIGLRLANPSFLRGKSRSETVPLMGVLLKEYRLASPVITAWAGRGDFKPDRFPERVTPVLIKHASRTAGRIRAKGIRKLRSIGSNVG